MNYLPQKPAKQKNAFGVEKIFMFRDANLMSFIVVVGNMESYICEAKAK
jgi:hypothetical protein